MDKKLEVKNLKISFRTQAGIVQAVRNISFDLYKGETFAIVGESGSGKSVTSKSIMGILANNAIVESGEIIYDGQDLLKISEDDYHKIRGDKIAMIFQDPMSSLNPIMKIGKQLTEAMILKAKASKKNARRNFNNLLEVLRVNIKYANANNSAFDSKKVDEMIKIFDSFCIESTKIEDVYNEAVGAAEELNVELQETAFLISKNQKVDIVKSLRSVLKQLRSTQHQFVVSDISLYESKIANLILEGKSVNPQAVVELYNELDDFLEKALLQEKPNFFRLGYYKMYNPTEEFLGKSVQEINEICLDYLMKNFFNEFLKICETAVIYSHNTSIEAKKAILPEIEKVLAYFSNETIEEKESYKEVKELIKAVNESIDRLEIKKNGTQYVFHSAINAAIKDYFYAVRQAPIEEKKYLDNKAKYEALIEKGKRPDWTLKPQICFDIPAKRADITRVLNGLKNSLITDINNVATFDSYAKTVEVIDYFKEEASKVVIKMNQRIAKSKAIKLMEEVGIPDPAIRFNQYPFEFSGGMRQRIVIAIALSANPDILICDEPTTALDVTIQSQILELINVVKKQRNLSVIFITHNLGVVANMADRIAVMYAGKIVEYGKSEEIFYEPRHPYTWALLSSMPDLHTKDKLDSIPGTPPNMIYPPKGDAFAARNKYALEIDFEMEPPLFEVSETHKAATWLLHPDAPKVEMPKIIRDRVERVKKEMEEDARQSN